MNRRESLKVLALGTGALVALPGLGGMVNAARAQNAGNAPAGKPDTTAAANGAAPIGPFTLPPLGYAVDALEPFIDAKTMEIHHDKHHAGYVASLNKEVADKPELASRSIEDLMRNLSKLPTDVVTAVRNFGGGHYNHTLFWPQLKKDGAKQPSGELAAAVDKRFGGFSVLQDYLTTGAMQVFGSGWAWLVLKDGDLTLEITGNQDTPLSLGHVPLLGIDVWEHAYYLKHQNRRADYVAAFHQVVDWDVVSQRFKDAPKG
jgi:Fe-Mn family superoxide dismutase